MFRTHALRLHSPLSAIVCRLLSNERVAPSSGSPPSCEQEMDIRSPTRLLLLLRKLQYSRQL
jgi:hypothetical protein